MTNKIVICIVSSSFSAIFGVKLLQAFLLFLRKFEVVVALNVTLLLLSTLLVFAFFGLYLSWCWSEKIRVRHLLVMTSISLFIMINDFYYNFFWAIFSWLYP